MMDGKHSLSRAVLVALAIFTLGRRVEGQPQQRGGRRSRAPSLPTTTAERQCFCTFDYNPVCCEDPDTSEATTYSNQCTATCDGMDSCSEGACETETECICTFDYTPVCCEDPDTLISKTYSNQCSANCDGFDSCSDGECVPEIACLCVAEYEPVCCENPETMVSTTYSNQCMATCDGLDTCSDGACSTDSATETPCICAASYAPVCCEDPDTLISTTYSNECSAGCDGFDSCSAGACTPDGACVCLDVLDPVCCVNPESMISTTYSSQCMATCDGFGTCFDGECTTDEAGGSFFSWLAEGAHFFALPDELPTTVVVLVALAIFVAVAVLRRYPRNSKKQYKRARTEGAASDFEMSDVEAARVLNR